MNSQRPTILAIVPEKKCFGFAVFTAGELTHFSTHSLGNKSATSLLRKPIPSTIRRMIETFEPQVIVVRSATQYQKSSTILGPAIRIIGREAMRARIGYVAVALTEIKSALCNDARPTQRKAFLRVANLYPELRRFVDKTSKWQERYYRSLLAAVSVGVTYLQARGTNGPNNGLVNFKRR